MSTAFSAGRFCSVSGKLQQTLRATGIHRLFASPGVISDSCIIQGIFSIAAARTTGTLTNPPLLKTISGFNVFRIFLASTKPLSGTCSKMIDFEVENNIIKSVAFTGGCNGNLKGISALVAGMSVDDAISKLHLPASAGVQIRRCEILISYY